MGANVPKGGKKERPGRPRTKPRPPELEIRGVVAEPQNPAAAVELVHQSPTILKRLNTIFNNLKTVKVLVFLFEARAVTIQAKNNDGVVVAVHIDPAQCASYFHDGAKPRYCAGFPLTKSSKKIFTGLNRDLQCIQFRLNRDSAASTMVVTTSDGNITISVPVGLSDAEAFPLPAVAPLGEEGGAGALRSFVELSVEHSSLKNMFAPYADNDLVQEVWVHKDSESDLPLYVKFSLSNQDMQSTVTTGGKTAVRAAIEDGDCYAQSFPHDSIKKVVASTPTPAITILFTETLARFEYVVDEKTPEVQIFVFVPMN